MLIKDLFQLTSHFQRNNFKKQIWNKAISNYEKAIKYNDKKLNIKWPTKKPVVSKKDQNAITFIEFKKKYLK